MKTSRLLRISTAVVGGLGLAIAIVAIWFLPHGTPTVGSAATTTSGNKHVGVMVEASRKGGSTLLSYQVKKANVVLYGKVTKIDSARWNSPDGKEDWTPKNEDTLKLIYTTFYVEPTTIIKGTPEWGTPVAFRTAGGTVGSVPQVQGDAVSPIGGLQVGDEVLVFGAKFPGIYGEETVYKPKGYWLLEHDSSLLVKRGTTFENVGGSEKASENNQTLETLTGLLKKAMQ